MKTRLLIIIVFSVTILSLGTMFTTDVFGWCPENEDWHDAPCYAAAYQKDLWDEKLDWGHYYDYKGVVFMEQKKQEMLDAIKNNQLDEWIASGPVDQNHNVYAYYEAYAESENSTTADIQWKEASFSSNAGTKATVIVTDHDMNKHPAVVDYIWIKVHSDSDGVGFRMTLFETDFDSGVFKGDVIFAETFPSGGGFLHIVDGDTITAKYEDRNFPSDYVSKLGNIVVSEDKIEMFATALVGRTGPPLERAPASNFMILDVRKNPIENNLIAVDQQIRLVSDLENQMSRIQPFAYLVQIQNEQNQVESLSWLTGNLTASQKINSGSTWIPLKEGKYFATVFVWESIDNPTALSPPLSMEFLVK